MPFQGKAQIIGSPANVQIGAVPSKADQYLRKVMVEVEEVFQCEVSVDKFFLQFTESTGLPERLPDQLKGKFYFIVRRKIQDKWFVREPGLALISAFSAGEFSLN